MAEYHVAPDEFVQAEGDNFETQCIVHAAIYRTDGFVPGAEFLGDVLVDWDHLCDEELAANRRVIRQGPAIDLVYYNDTKAVVRCEPEVQGPATSEDMGLFIRAITKTLGRYGIAVVAGKPQDPAA